MARVKITWTRSTINRPMTQQKTITALGLKRLHHSVEHELTPQIQGMITSVTHLVTVEPLEK